MTFAFEFGITRLGTLQSGETFWDCVFDLSSSTDRLLHGCFASCGYW